MIFHPIFYEFGRSAMYCYPVLAKKCPVPTIYHVVALLYRIATVIKFPTEYCCTTMYL